jgi:hypothetical protein
MPRLHFTLVLPLALPAFAAADSPFAFREAGLFPAVEGIRGQAVAGPILPLQPPVPLSRPGSDATPV